MLVLLVIRTRLTT